MIQLLSSKGTVKIRTIVLHSQ